MQAEQLTAQRVIALLHEWGWETGLEKLKSEITETTDERRRTSLQYLVGWMAGERGAHEVALEQFEALVEMPGLYGWAKLGQAFVELRESKYTGAHATLDEALAQGDCDDPIFRATAAHCRGAVYYHQCDERAISLLHEALSIFGKDHFGTGRVLDSLGMVYTSKDNFHAAREFFNRAIECKQRFKDSAGVAVSHGQLGRLYLDWGNSRKAEEHFKTDLKISRQIGDRRGEAQMYNLLGNVAAATGAWEKAAGWLDKSIQLNQGGGWKVSEGFARKDRAVVHMKKGEAEAACAEAGKAEDLFRAAGFAEGMAHVNRVWGMVRRAQGQYLESERALNEALRHFEVHGERAEAARAQLELARTLSAQGAPGPLITDALQDALDRAERCRRDVLVAEVENELKEIDEAAYYRNAHRRARGRNAPAETNSLLTGRREQATVLFLDVQGSTDYARSRDPEVVMMTLNQMMAEFAAVLERHEISVTAYLGDGFMALVRDLDNAPRAVTAALDLGDALREFNQPRDILGLQPLNVRVGIATGEVFIGNVGTYDKMDFTAIGTTANLAARLQSEAEPGIPCVSRETREKVQDHFIFRDDNPRLVDLKGLNIQEAWEVVGRKET